MIKTVVIGLGSLILVSAAVFLLVVNPGQSTDTAAESSEASEVMTEAAAVTYSETEMATPSPVPTLTLTLTPTPSPTPAPVYLESLDGCASGDVIDDELIDTDNLGVYFTSSEITAGDAVYQRIYGQSFVENSDIAIGDLRYLKLLHVNFDGRYQVGELIVNVSVAQQVLDIFEQLCDAGYEIYSMYLIDDFWVGNGTDSDTYSIDCNNTSSFCYRPASGSSHISLHALGLAIDINPQQNPYVRVNSDGSLHYSHENAAEYVSDRSSSVPHVITEEDYAYQLFTSNGWTWGGSWYNPRDYQHFQYG